MICKHIWCQILFLHNFSIRSAVAWILKSFSFFFHSFPPLKGELKTWSWGASKGLFECVSCCAWEMNKLKPCKRLLVTLPTQADRCAHYFAWLCSSMLCQNQEGIGKSIPAARDISWGFRWTTNILSSLIHPLGMDQKIAPFLPRSIYSVKINHSLVMMREWLIMIECAVPIRILKSARTGHLMAGYII